MTPFRFILASLHYFRRIHFSVAAGVAVATAVLTGALLVGDSVRGSLRELTLERLGRIDFALAAGHLFREELAEELSEDDRFRRYFGPAEPAILMTGTLQSGSGDAQRRATQVSLIGVRPAFWEFESGAESPDLAPTEVAITQALARELGVEKGDSLLVRVPSITAMPSDSVLGEKSETSKSRSFTVGAVLADEGLARFGLLPSQHAPRNAFLALGALQGLLDQAGRANALLVAGREAAPPAPEMEEVLVESLRPTLEDYGLVLEPVRDDTRWQVAASQLVLAPPVVAAAERAFAGDRLQPVVTYLANTIRVGAGAGRSIPYSTITGVDSTEAGPLLDDKGLPVRLADDEIALNRWAADNLDAKIGDPISITYYEPESTHGRLREHPPVRFRLAHIADLETADGELTGAADPKLTPELPGVTDQASINDWELPFELDEPIRSEDEEYWDDYRTTPKAFVSLATAKRLWPSRWGTISLFRLPMEPEGASPAGTEASARKVADRLLASLEPGALGMAFMPVKSQGLAAASGTTPFDALFLAFSFFLIAAALVLIALLFQLGVQQRATELGTLAAAGVGRKQIARLLSREGLVVAASGAAVGVVGGILYAWLMVLGLRTWWVEAIATPFLELHITPRSLILGWLLGVLVSWVTIWWSIRRLARLSAARLLAGKSGGSLEFEPALPRTQGRGRFAQAMRLGLLAAIVGLVIVAFRTQAETQAGAFFGSGALVLILLFFEVRRRLRRNAIQASSRRFGMASLSAINIARNPGRSALTIGLVGAASFLILAIGAFRLEPSDAGTGGFSLLATSDQPVHYDLNTPEGRLELGFRDDESDALANWRVYSLRVAAGEDASCLNLYQASQPRVLGVPSDLIGRGGFAWAAAAPAGDSEPPRGNAATSEVSGGAATGGDSNWTLLRRDLGKDESGRAIVPVVLDMSTAYYSLHLVDGVGDRLVIQDGAKEDVTLEVVGLLKNSVLQGSLLISEENFLELFPDVGGYRFFMIEALAASESAGDGNGGAGRISELLESRLTAEGFDAVDAEERLAGYLAVQNTYLSTFQTIGFLGLLLGTIGLGVVQLRSILERRGELALMRAAGFGKRRLMQMVLWENGVLLGAGLAVGMIAASVATFPQWGRSDVAIPWSAVGALVASIALVGLIAGWLTARSALAAPLIPALRGE